MTQSIERAQKWLGLAVTISAVIGAFVYMGQRSERDRVQTEMLERISVDLRSLSFAAQETSTRIEVLSERIVALEHRIKRLEDAGR